ncbi:MAG: hypothetical protein ACOCP4_03065 [Candidatus Woesearchaeota archaeon]
MLIEPSCSKRRCKHYRGVIQPDGTELSERFVCDAYPSGIPDDIAAGNDPHEQVREDQDNDIIYEEEQ